MIHIDKYSINQLHIVYIEHHCAHSFNIRLADSGLYPINFTQDEDGEKACTNAVATLLLTLLSYHGITFIEFGGIHIRVDKITFYCQSPDFERTGFWVVGVITGQEFNSRSQQDIDRLQILAKIWNE